MKKENLFNEIQKHQIGNIDKNVFYLPRKDFAKNLVKNLYKFGGSYSLFQIRRKGKTTFLLNEFANEASNYYYVFYYSFMNKNQNSYKELENDFKKTLLEFALTTIAGKVRNFDKITKHGEDKMLLSFGFSILNNFLKIEKNKKELIKNEEIESISISDILTFINEYRNLPILLIFDEFQELARTDDKNVINFIRELRTELDKRKDFLQCVFTGSSWHDLEKLFSNYNSPFFQFGTKINFPDLNEDFIYHCLDVYEKETKIKLNAKHFLQIFEETGKFPLVIIDLLKLMILNNNHDPFYFLNTNLIKHENDFLNKKWINLSDLEKVILFTISCVKKEKISSKNNLIKFSQWLNQNISENKINYALKKLLTLQVIRKEKQKWFIVEKDFEDFIRNEIQNEQNLLKFI